MKYFTDGVLTIEVGRKYANVLNKAGAWIGRADITDGSFMDKMIAAKFKEYTFKGGLK